MSPRAAAEPRAKAGAGAGRRPLIGVIGGLGPAATLDFYARVVSLTRAATDQEHVRLLIDADPDVPNRNESVAGTGPSSAPALVAKARRLQRAGAELLVMACNAAHAYQAEIVDAARLPFVSIVDEAVSEAAARAPAGAAFGVLATTGTLDAGLYQHAMRGAGRSAVTLAGEELASFMRLIYRVKAGDTGSAVRAGMLALARSLVAAGAEAIVAGCTEVPLVLEHGDLEVPLIDATESLARAVVRLGGAAVTPSSTAK